MKKIFYLVTLVIFSLLFVQCEEEPDGKGVHEGHEFVDLGLPSGLKWAAYNVGAESPEQSGDYFAWGEVKPKRYYDWSSYKYCIGTGSTLTKYCFDSEYGKDGFTDNKTILDLEDDAAHVNWGGNWRMPTVEECEELEIDCEWTWTTQNGINGHKVTGPNGNSIFLPLAGYMIGGTQYVSGTWGSYWSSSLTDSSPFYSNCLSFGLDEDNNNKDMIDFFEVSRSNGRSVRPVCP